MTTLAKFYAWRTKTFKEMLSLDEGVALAKKHSDEYAAALNNIDFTIGNLWRFAKFYDMRYTVLPEKTNNICTTFKMQYKDHDMIYAILYSDATYHPEYLCLAYTFNSMDGEFRRNFIQYYQLDYVYKQYPLLIEAVETYFIGWLESGDITLHHESFGKFDKHKMHLAIDNGRLPIRLLVAHWICNVPVLQRGDIPVHLSVGYAKTFVEPTRDLYKTLGESRELMTEIYKATKQLTVWIHKNDIKQIDVAAMVTRIGQKYSLPTLEECMQPMDISHGLWREIYVAKLVSALPINNITAGVSIYLDWIVVPGMSPALFDNYVSYQKIASSIRGERINIGLSSVRGYTAEQPNLITIDEEITEVQTSVEHTTILGEDTICSIVEDVGFTWGNIVNTLLQSRGHLQLGPILADAWTASRYMFDIVYTALALNRHCGVLQGDLHYNNATLYLVYNSDINRNFGNPAGHFAKQRIVYRIANKLYIFPHYGRYGCIIDYSRSLVSEKVIRDDPNLPDELKRKAMLDQYVRAMSMINRYRPQFYTDHHAKLLVGIEADFMGFWQVLRCVDCLQFSQNVKIMLNDILHNPKTQRDLGDQLNVSMLKQHFIPLLDSIIGYCDNYLDSGLRQLTTDARVRLENPNAEIIDKFFGDCLMQAAFSRAAPRDYEQPNSKAAGKIDNKAAADQPNSKAMTADQPNSKAMTADQPNSKAMTADQPNSKAMTADQPDETPPTIIDYLSMENQIKYSATDYDNFPPICNLDTLLKHGYIKLDPAAKYGKQNYLASQKAATRAAELFQQQARAHSKQLRKIPDDDEYQINFEELLHLPKGTFVASASDSQKTDNIFGSILGSADDPDLY